MTYATSEMVYEEDYIEEEEEETPQNEVFHETNEESEIIILAESYQQTPVDETASMLKELSELDLPSEDGVPMETNWHRLQMNFLIELVHSLWPDRTDYFVGGNMFIYFSMQQIKNKDYKGPDFFLVKNTDGTRDRDSWKLWEEQGLYPDVIIELASPSTIHIDKKKKKQMGQEIAILGNYGKSKVYILMLS